MEDLIKLAPEDGIQASVSAINLQLPPFFVTNSRLWFGNIEALFFAQLVKDETQRYADLAKNLTFHFSEQVQDLIHDRMCVDMRS